MINQIISIFLPSSFGTLIYIKNTENKEAYLLPYMINTILTNLISYSLALYLFNLKKFNFTNLFTIKYSLASILISIFIGIIMTLINKYFNLKVEVVKNEKSTKNTKKNTKNNK